MLRRLDADLGSELQDRVKESAKTFMRYRRPRGVSAAEHIVTFERLYADANAHGLYYSPVTLTMLLLESCQLTENQEQWVMQCVAGDYSRYAEVRRALRRMPGLDVRHGREASNWVVGESEKKEETETWEEAEEGEDGGTYAADYDYESETDESDDYCSTASNASEQTYMLLQQGWAIKRRRRFNDRKAGRYVPRRRKKRFGKHGKGQFPLDTRRNYSDEIPQGWTKEKWLSRTPCVGCGSRWHRDCTKQKHKAGKGKKGGKKGKKGGAFATFFMSAALAASSAYLPHASAFEMNSMTCLLCTDIATDSTPCFEFQYDLQAAMNDAVENDFKPSNMFSLSASEDYVGSSPIPTSVFMLNVVDGPKPEEEMFYDCNDCDDMFSCCNSSEQTTMFLNPNITTLPNNCIDLIYEYLADKGQLAVHTCCLSMHRYNHVAFSGLPMPDASSCFSIWKQNNMIETHQDCWVGVESQYGREERYCVFGKSSRIRFGLMVDTGAPDNVVGGEWLNRFCDSHELHQHVDWRSHYASLSGIGRGSIETKWRAKCPISLSKDHNATWDVQVLSGAGSRVPPLWGLESQIKHRAKFDFSDPQNLTVSCLINPNVRKTYKLETINGHLILPCDHFEHSKPIPIPSKSQFINDPLGLATWMIDPIDNEQAENDDNPDDTVFVPWTWPSEEQHTDNNTDTTIPTTTFPIQCDEPLPPPPGFPVLACENGQMSQPFSHSVDVAQPINSTSTYTRNILLTFNTRHNDQHNNCSPVLTKRKKDQEKQGEIKTFETFVKTVDQQAQNTTQQAMAASLRTVRRSTKTLKQITSNATYKKKYQGLPTNTPIPKYDEPNGTWDFWEFWSGCGKLTRYVLDSNVDRHYHMKQAGALRYLITVTRSRNCIISTSHASSGVHHCAHPGLSHAQL